MKLLEEFQRIKQNHEGALVRRAARVVLGSSVIRVFEENTKAELQTFLAGLPVKQLGRLNSEQQYRAWFEIHLEALAGEIKKLNPQNSRIFPGYKWGHAAKVLNLLLREVVLNTRYFPDPVVARVSPWLFSPVDGVVISRLHDLGYKLPFTQIKGIDTAKKFFMVQELLSEAARQVGVPRVWFDDNWGDRQ